MMIIQVVVYIHIITWIAEQLLFLVKHIISVLAILLGLILFQMASKCNLIIKSASVTSWLIKIFFHKNYLFFLHLNLYGLFKMQIQIRMLKASLHVQTQRIKVREQLLFIHREESISSLFTLEIPAVPFVRMILP